jgi:nitroreductase
MVSEYTIFRRTKKRRCIVKVQILEAFHFRHACKEFDPERTIPEEDFSFLLETARLSPSSFGFEPWKLMVIQDRALRERLREHTWGGQRQIPTASHLIAVLARRGATMRHDSPYIETFMERVKELPEEARKKRLAIFEAFQKRDFNLLESERAMFDWACKQTYIAMANMMTAAALIGIDTCPIEGFDAQKIDGVLEAALGMDPVQLGISYMLAFGYRVSAPPKKTRQSLSEIVTWH